MSLVKENELAIICYCQSFDDWVIYKREPQNSIFIANNSVSSDEYTIQNGAEYNVEFYNNSGWSDYMKQLRTVRLAPIMNQDYDVLSPIVINGELKLPILADDRSPLSCKSLLLPPHPNILQGQIDRMGNAIVYLVNPDDFSVGTIQLLLNRILEERKVPHVRLLSKLFSELVEVVEYFHSYGLIFTGGDKSIIVHNWPDLSQPDPQDIKTKIMIHPFIDGTDAYPWDLYRIRYGIGPEIFYGMKNDYVILSDIFDEMSTISDGIDVSLFGEQPFGSSIRSIVDKVEYRSVNWRHIPIPQFHITEYKLPEATPSEAKLIVQEIKRSITMDGSEVDSGYEAATVIEFETAKTVLNTGKPFDPLAPYTYLRRPLNMFQDERTIKSYAKKARRDPDIIQKYQEYRSHFLDQKPEEPDETVMINSWEDIELPQTLEPIPNACLIRTLEVLKMQLGLDLPPLEVLNTIAGESRTDIIISRFKQNNSISYELGRNIHKRVRISGIEFLAREISAVFHDTILADIVTFTSDNPIEIDIISRSDAKLMREFLNSRIMAFTFYSSLSTDGFIKLSASGSFLETYEMQKSMRQMFDRGFKLGEKLINTVINAYINNPNHEYLRKTLIKMIRL